MCSLGFSRCHSGEADGAWWLLRGIFSLRAEKKAVAENVQAGMEAAPPTVGTSDFAADRASPRCFASHRTKSEISVLDIQCGRVAGRVING